MGRTEHDENWGPKVFLRSSGTHMSYLLYLSFPSLLEETEQLTSKPGPLSEQLWFTTSVSEVRLAAAGSNNGGNSCLRGQPCNWPFRVPCGSCSCCEEKLQRVSATTGAAH